MMWTNKRDTSKNTQLTNSIGKILMTIKQLKQQIKPSVMPTEEHTKPRELLHREISKGKRKRDQRGINKPPVVPIFHPHHHNIKMQVCKGDTLHQNRPNSGSKGEECLVMEHRRSKDGPVLKEIKKPIVPAIDLSTKPQNMPNKPRNRITEPNMDKTPKMDEIKKDKITKKNRITEKDKTTKKDSPINWKRML
eukprot:1775407-Ditylum_brightwellii.AAC.1